jgi:tRNA G18 (ribose-2'-O)-methylase SpoU
MTRKQNIATNEIDAPRGFFAVGIDHGKTPANLGSLWRTADLFGAAFIFTIGHRYKQQASDTMKSWRHTPLFHFSDVTDLVEHLPYSCPLVGVELDPKACALGAFAHPTRAAYVLGAEDNGLTGSVMRACHALVQLPGRHSMNVACAGSIVIYDRFSKGGAS